MERVRIKFVGIDRREFEVDAKVGESLLEVSQRYNMKYFPGLLSSLRLFLRG